MMADEIEDKQNAQFEPVDPTPPTPVEEVNQAIASVASKAEEWANLSHQFKLELLKQIRENIDEEKLAWVDTGCRMHGFSPADPKFFHEKAGIFAKGPLSMGATVSALITTYTSLVKTKYPPVPHVTRRSPSGKVIAQVFPYTTQETIMSKSGGMVQELHLEDGAPLKQIDPNSKSAGVCAVLGMGNTDGLYDLLSRMFVENKVVVYKANPVNEGTAPHYMKILEPLIEKNYLAVVFGGVPQGSALLGHDLVTEALMTGSDRTYNAIVWGTTDQEEVKNKPEAEMKFKKPFTVELGAVSPWIVVPGKWTEGQIDKMAQMLVAAKMFNNGHVCASPQALLTCKNWPQREEFLLRVSHWLRKYPGTSPFYPGSERAYQAHHSALSGSDAKDSVLVQKNPKLFLNQQHPVFATGLCDPESFSLKNEAFCPVLTEIPLDTDPTTSTFLEAAVSFANDNLWGTLSASIMADNTVLKRDADAIDKAIDDLRYGAVAVNQWAGYMPTFGALIWGGYPGAHTPNDIGSGIGHVNNAMCFDRPCKGVAKFPMSYPGQLDVPLDGRAKLKEIKAAADYFIRPTYMRMTKLAMQTMPCSIL